MCGIMGVVGRRRERDWERWGRLTEHRGPDAFGLWYDEHALLGHNRLAIIDLSESANQPMVEDQGDLVIVFNGEIFNFLDLRAELEDRGVTCRTHSDTEVLLHGYRVWGASILDRLDGMFSFAIWNRRSKLLFAARDHVGIKPFFYRHVSGGFAFGSELKLLTALADSVPEIRVESIYEYLIYSYIPAPYTPYKGFMKLEPGHYLEYDAVSDRLAIARWWSVPKAVEPGPSSVDDASQELRKVFRQTIERRMISDVPLGAFLSGGIDSSTIVAEMVASGQSVKTFSVGYRDNPEYDETIYAQEVARALGVEHMVLYPEFTDADMENYLNLIIDHFDEPYGNPTVAMTHLLTKSARDHVKVALVGDGGDELFGGYPRHKALLLAAKVGPWIGPVVPLVLKALRYLPETPSGNHRVRRARRFLSYLTKSSSEAFQQWSSVFPADVVMFSMAAMPSEELTGVRSNYIGDRFSSCGNDSLSSALYADLNSFVPYNLLEGGDRMSMANGFELRVPFVARGMIEFAASLPPTMKINGGVQKYILKHAYRDVLPESIRNRKKRGFNPPVWHWLQANEHVVRSRLTDGVLNDFVSPAYIGGLLSEFFSRRGDHSTQLWMLLVLQHWLKARSSDHHSPLSAEH